MTAPWEDRLTPAARDALARWRQGAAESAGFADWAAFMAHLEEERTREDDPHRHDQPPPEHTTRDGWPEGFDTPRPIVLLLAAVHSSWEVATGYARGYRKVGRGNVGTGADARWELTHTVILEARPMGMEGRAWVRIAYVAPAVEGKLTWKHDASSALTEWKSTVTKAKAILVQDAVVAVATVSASRQSVAPVTDMFAA